MKKKVSNADAFAVMLDNIKYAKRLMYIKCYNVFEKIHL